jgi:hypothetical protein
MERRNSVTERSDGGKVVETVRLEGEDRNVEE